MPERMMSADAEWERVGQGSPYYSSPRSSQKLEVKKSAIPNSESSSEAEELIPKGWRFIGILPNGKVVLEGSDEYV